MTETRAERLKRAAQLVDSVRSELDTTHTVCNSCSMKHYGNWDEAKLAEALEGIAKNLYRKSKDVGGMDRRSRVQHDVEEVRLSEAKKRAAPWEGREPREDSAQSGAEEETIHDYDE